jgi:hypothetical protein
MRITGKKSRCGQPTARAGDFVAQYVLNGLQPVDVHAPSSSFLEFGLILAESPEDSLVRQGVLLAATVAQPNLFTRESAVSTNYLKDAEALTPAAGIGKYVKKLAQIANGDIEDRGRLVARANHPKSLSHDH